MYNVAVSGLPVRVRERAGGVRASAQFERELQVKEKERNSDPTRAPAPASAKEKPPGEWLSVHHV